MWKIKLAQYWLLASIYCWKNREDMTPGMMNKASSNNNEKTRDRRDGRDRKESREKKESRDRREKERKETKVRTGGTGAGTGGAVPTKKEKEVSKNRDDAKRRRSTKMGRVAGEEAMRYSEDFDMHSKLARRTRKRRVLTRLRWSDLKIGKLLGEGNFSHVYEIKLRKEHEPLPDDVETVITAELNNPQNFWNADADSFVSMDDEVSDIWDMVSTTSAHDEDDSDDSSQEEVTYALKHLHPQMTEKQRDFTASAIDLVLEAKILAHLDHPNIVKLFGVTKGSISTVFAGHGYFLLLDRLYGTLEDKIQEWISTEMIANMALQARRSSASGNPQMTRRYSNGGSSSRRSSQDKNGGDGTAEGMSYKERCKLVDERIRTVGLDVARGMEYLHQHRIVFRDLKPSNVGFTAKGTVRIFDFGLAKEIIDSKRRLTGNTGSLRYMAPEGKKQTKQQGVLVCVCVRNKVCAKRVPHSFSLLFLRVYSESS